MRFYEPDSGTISVDGMDISGITQSSLRRNIGMIQQDVYMFAGTIRENIRYGRPDATDDEIVEAARLAEIHDEIMQMPDGYDSYIGERGVMLSGGQKQRLSIARVFLKTRPYSYWTRPPPPSIPLQSSAFRHRSTDSAVAARAS